MMRLLCRAVRDETADVRTWTFADVTGTPVSFQAGQALTLALPMESGPVRRTFSIASSAARSGTIELTIKAHAGGHATRWMRERLGVGVSLDATLPHGRFVLPDGPLALALVSAGSGATPLMAMVRTLADRDADNADIAWIHVARHPADVLFAAELAVLQSKLPRLAVAIAVTRPRPGWFGYHGRLGRRLLSVMVQDLASRDVFCCGPVGFMDEVRRVHAAEGGDGAGFHVEHYSQAAASPPPPAEPGPADGYMIEIDGRSFAAQPSETILEAAGRSKVVIPCGCCGGMCGTCRVRLRTGQVEMRHQGGLLPAEEADGWILACSAWPRSDLRLAL